MKVKKNLLRVLILFILFISIMCLNKIYASTVSFTPNPINVTAGNTFSVTVNVTAGSWSLSVNGGGLTSVGDASGLVGQTTTPSNANVSKTYTFKASTVGNYTITLSGDVTDFDTDETADITRTIAVTVTAPPVQQPTPTPPPVTKPTPVTLTFSNATGKMYTTDSVRFRSHYDTSDNKNIIKTLDKGTAVTITGKATGWYRVTYNGTTGYISSDYLTKTKPETPPSTEPSTPPSTSPDEKSNDATLKSLSITGVQISPEFASNVTSYTANVEEDVTQAEVLAVANSEKAKVEITGNENLQNGENTIVVKVTAEDGTVNNYEIKLTVGKIEKPLIAVMGIKENDEKIELVLENPVTTSEGYIEYTINLAEWLKSIEILENGNDENIVYVGTGTYDLIAGENSYIVIVRVPQDGAQEESIHYMLKINNPAKVVPATEENKIDYKLIAIIGAGVLFVIIVITAIVVHNKKKNDLDYGETDYSFLRDDEDIQSKEKDRKQEFLDNFSNNDDDDKRRGGKHF